MAMSHFMADHAELFTKASTLPKGGMFVSDSRWTLYLPARPPVSVAFRADARAARPLMLPALLLMFKAAQTRHDSLKTTLPSLSLKLQNTSV